MPFLNKGPVSPLQDDVSQHEPDWVDEVKVVESFQMIIFILVEVEIIYFVSSKDGAVTHPLATVPRPDQR